LTGIGRTILPWPATLLAGGVAALVGLLGVVEPRLALVIVGGIAFSSVAVVSPVYGVAGFVVLTFFERLPGLTGYPITKPVGALLVASMLLGYARGRRDVPFLPSEQPVVAALLLGFLVFAGASATWAVDANEAIAASIRLLLVVVLLFIVYAAVTTPDDLRLLSWAYVSGAALVGVTAFVTGEWIEGRLTSSALDPNFLAATFVSSSMLALFMMTAARTRFEAGLLVLVISVLVVSLVATQSRGGLVAGGAALAAALIFGGPFRKTISALLLVLVGAGILYFGAIAPTVVRERVTNISAEGSASRTDTWSIALDVAGDHPLVGVGLGNFTVVEPRYVADSDLPRARLVLENLLVVHNTYLEVLGELGVFGLAALVAAVAAVFVSAVRGVRSLGSEHLQAQALIRGLIVASVGLLTAYVFLSAQYEKHLWLLLGLLAAVPNVAASARSAVPERLASDPIAAARRAVEEVT
jgi:O-antigen ligase